MTFIPTKIENIKRVASQIIESCENIKDTCDEFAGLGMNEIALHFKTFQQLAKSATRTASQFAYHAKNQYDCSQSGDEPEWRMNQRRSAHDAAVIKAKESLESQGLIKSDASVLPKKKTAKKATKKKGTP